MKKEFMKTRVYFLEGATIHSESLLFYIERFFPEFPESEYQNFDVVYFERDKERIPKAYYKLWHVLYWEYSGFSIESAKERAFKMRSGTWPVK